MFESQVVEKIETHFLITFFPKIVPFMRYMKWVEPDRPQMTT